MLCINPFVKDPTGRCFHTTNKDEWFKGIPFPCGKCLPCRINKRKMWTLRMLLELKMHDDALFVTLTYDDDHLVFNEDMVPQLCKHDVQTFLKRLRKRIGKLRYYVCGEYGENTHRPHYHMVLFGVSPLFQPIIEKEWSNGFCSFGTVTRESIQYVAGYVTKKLGNANNSNVNAEFSCMSLRPALGVPALSVVLREFEHYGVIKKNNDGTVSFPSTLVIGHARYPFGRTLLDKLCALLDSEYDKSSYLMEMRSRYASSDKRDVCLPDGSFIGSLSKALIDESAQRNKQIKARFKIFNHRNKV